MSDERLHHLTLEAGGRWVMRVTVQLDPKLVGKQICIRLGKCTETQAIKLRDNYLRVLEKVGAVVRLRRQKRRSRT